MASGKLNRQDAAMVKKLFDEKFPPGTELGAPLPPAPAVTAAPVIVAPFVADSAPVTVAPDASPSSRCTPAIAVATALLGKWIDPAKKGA